MRPMIRVSKLAPLPRDELVADVIDVSVEEVSSLGPFRLAESAVHRVPARGPRGAYMRHDDVDDLLAPYAPDAAAGVPDAAIAGRVGLSPEQVRRWRIRRELRVCNGRPRAPVMARFAALHLLGAGPGAAPHAVEPSDNWHVPEYVLRVPLAYTDFCRVVRSLVDDGVPVRVIARGIGVLERDVIEARRMAERSVA